MNIQNDVKLTNEADLYGFSRWLAVKLGYEFVPPSLRGFQHGWIWWDVSLCPPVRALGLDPNINEFWGELVQDLRVERNLLNRKIFAKAAGLPFSTFLAHEQTPEIFPERIANSVLFVPRHSNPWENHISQIVGTIKRLSKETLSSVLLSVDDYKFVSEIKPYVDRVELGAGALQSQSFYRLAKIFRTYDYMITSHMGSHVRYAAECGMKIGLLSEPFQQECDHDLRLYSEGSFNLKSLVSYDAYKSITDVANLAKWYPKLLINSVSECQHIQVPTFELLPLSKIADLLGWNITYPSAKAKK
jgi:hypothetical protein